MKTLNISLLYISIRDLTLLVEDWLKAPNFSSNFFDPTIILFVKSLAILIVLSS